MLQHVTLELRREEWPAAKRFWETVGFHEVDPPGSLGERSAWVQRDGTQIHLLFADDAVVPPHGHVAVVARDYEAALERLRAAGFEPDHRREHWGSPRCFVRAPGGHRVEVMAFPPS